VTGAAVTSAKAPSTAQGAAVAVTPASLEPAPSGAGPAFTPPPPAAASPTVMVGPGAGVAVSQDLESDRIRRAWASKGGTVPSFEVSAGTQIMYKDLSQQAGEGAYMSGVGLNGGLRLALLGIDSPKYETRDTSWFAWKLGIGLDLGSMTATINAPAVGMSDSARMTSTAVVFSLGVMKAFGSFTGPNEWSGVAIGLEWAPSSTSTTLTDSYGNSTRTSSFNPTGFAVNFESGTLQSMAGSKARFKARIFLLPPVDEMPLLLTMSLGAVWY